jgi:hypothetical protein
MAIKRFWWVGLVGLLLAADGGGRAQGNAMHFEGAIHDQTTPAFGSWVIHGSWTLDLKGNSGRGDFTAALSMERADLFFVLSTNSNANDLTVRNAHTHHITMANASVTSTATGFTLNGPASITGNGATPPFGTASTVTVSVTGGALVEFSNVTLTFKGDALSHFGSNPIAGVVVAVR